MLLRKNALLIFMSIELQLNAVNLALVAFSRMHLALDGQVLAFFSMVVAAAEVVVGPRDHRGRLPAAGHRRRRRRERSRRLMESSTGSAVPVSCWFVPALPLAVRSCMLFMGRRLGKLAGIVGERRGRPCRSSCRAYLVVELLASHPPEARLVVQHLFDWISVGRSRSRRRPSSRRALGDDDPGRHRRRAPDPRVRDRLHGGRPALRTVLRVPEPVRVLHAPAGPGRTTTCSCTWGGRASGSARTS